LRYIRSRASAHWVPGEASRQYLSEEGVKDYQIFKGCYNLDCDIISSQLEQRKEEGLRIRKDFSINEDGFVFLMVANVVPNRRHDLLLEAFSQVVAICPNSYLLLVGKGADCEGVVRLSKGKKMENIFFTGPVAFSDLPPLFSVADAYVHSGSETYSTAVAYAAIAGLPIITTPNVGAARDYVIDGETGFLVKSEDVTSFADKMIFLAQHREIANRFGNNAAKLESKFTAEWAAEQLEKAVAFATGHIMMKGSSIH